MTDSKATAAAPTASRVIDSPPVEGGWKGPTLAGIPLPLIGSAFLAGAGLGVWVAIRVFGPRKGSPAVAPPAAGAPSGSPVPCAGCGERQATIDGLASRVEVLGTELTRRSMEAGNGTKPLEVLEVPVTDPEDAPVSVIPGSAPPILDVPE